MKRRRTYTSVPEPRYVERARHCDDAAGSPLNNTIVAELISTDEGILVTYSTDSQLLLPIMGSDELVVDVNETNDKITIHLDNQFKNILARVLVTPSVTPSETEIVAIGTNGAQKQLSLQELANLLKPLL